MADCNVCGFSIESAYLCTVTSPTCPHRPLNTQGPGYGRDNPCEDGRCNICYPDPDPEWANEHEIEEQDQPMGYEDLEAHIEQHTKFIGGWWHLPRVPLPYLDDEIVPKTTELKDSGARQKFATGAQRDVSEGKGYFHLVPYDGLEPVAQVFEAGARKYEKRNWEKGIPVENFINSGLRHLNKAASGWVDEPHLAMAAWNIICALATIARIEAGTLPDELTYNSKPD